MEKVSEISRVLRVRNVFGKKLFAPSLDRGLDIDRASVSSAYQMLG